MTETVAAPATQPAAPPPPVAPPLPGTAPKPDGREQVLRELIEAMKGGQTIQEQLLKEHTQAIAANTRAMVELRLAIWGEDPSKEMPQGSDGLMDFIHDLGETVEDLDGRVTGTNLMMARYSWVFDRMSEINTGSTEAPELEAGKEPEAGKIYREGRVPVLKDMVAAIREFDDTAEKEAIKEAEEEEKGKKADEAKQQEPAAPAKAPMMGNAKPKQPPPPVFRKLPQMPIAPPMPGAVQ